MNKLFLGYIIFASVLVAIIIGVLFKGFILNSPDISTEVNLGCQIMDSNGDPKERINIVFISDKDTAKRLSEDLFSITPYDLNKNKFNLYYIPLEVYSPVCELYNELAVFCYSKSLLKASSVCPNDIIIVPQEQPSRIRSSSYMNVISLNTNNMKNTLAHEFGHVFANLADEYLPANIPQKSVNCVNSCQDFGDFSNSCFDGCSNSNKFRSIDNGLMKTLTSDDLGNFDIKITQDRIDEIIAKKSNFNAITGNALLDEELGCNKQHYVLIDGKTSNGILTIEKTSILQGCPGTNGNGPYTINLLMVDDSIYSSENFNSEIIFLESQDLTQQQISSDTSFYNGNFYLKTPLVYNSKKLQIFDSSNNLLSEVSVDFNDIIKILGGENDRPCKK